jgi:hypothetical protein
MNSQQFFGDYISDIIAIAKNMIVSTNVISISADDLANRLLKYRLEAAIKLQKMNPLYLILENITKSLGLQFKYKGTESILYDFSGRSNTVGKYYLYHITDGAKTILVNAIAVHDNNGDHKSKEWGARRRSTLYRYLKGQIQRSPYPDGIFVLDGEWEQKDINRLYRSGWNYVIRLNQLEATLKQFFNIQPSANFNNAVEYVLGKNAKLYKRLA